MRDPKIKEQSLRILSKHVQKEMTQMCAKSTKSKLRTTSTENLYNFSWSEISEEVEKHAPTLYRVLKGIVDVKRKVNPKSKNKKKTKKSYQSSDTAILAFCASVFLRHRNVHMNKVQKILSLILDCGHASKQVLRVLLY